MRPHLQRNSYEYSGRLLHVRLGSHEASTLGQVEIVEGPLAIGIDLGTTNCAAAIISPHGEPRLLRNRDGGTLTPTVIELDHDRNAYIGEVARNGAAANPHSIASEFKVHMGDMSWKFPVARHEYDATLLSAYMLFRIRKDAEDHLGAPVDYAVVTVPAYFNHLQRLATKRAAEIAGFEVLRLINEPTAAAIDHAREETAIPFGDLLVFDLGGGTLDVTILNIEDAQYNVAATAGLHDLGGLDWDEAIVNRITNAFFDQHGKNIRDDNAAMHDGRRKAEDAKKALTRKVAVPIFASASGRDVRLELSRKEFEQDTLSLVVRCGDLVDHVLDLAAMDRSDIDEVLLVGGATRMPMINELLEIGFPGRVSMSGHSDETVARGAAFVANREMVTRNLLPDGSHERGAPQFVDVTSHSLGKLLIANEDDFLENGADPELVNKILIPRFTPLPATGEANSSPLRGSERTLMTITEGETEDPNDCETLGEFSFDLGGKATGDETFVTTFAYDQSGILTAHVCYLETDAELEYRVDSTLGMTVDGIREAQDLLRSVRIE